MPVCGGKVAHFSLDFPATFDYNFTTRSLFQQIRALVPGGKWVLLGAGAVAALEDEVAGGIFRCACVLVVATPRSSRAP